MAAHAESNWWKDLLSLWKPSGALAGDLGLRLAVREGYLNFYSKGQSIGKITFATNGTPSLSIHEKYVIGAEAIGDEYLTLSVTDIRRKKAIVRKYDGRSSLHAWIKEAGGKTGKEKTLVDDLVGDNATVIDLEMGLPAFGEIESAYRIDCVALEEAGDVIRLIFWEAKLADDSRLRSKLTPGLLDQIKTYRRYLADPARARVVEAGYRTVCNLLLNFQAMAVTLGNVVELDPLIARAAIQRQPLKVEPGPRLVIFSGVHQTKGKWEDHRARLWEEFGIPYLELASRAPRHVLRRPEMVA